MIHDITKEYPDQFPYGTHDTTQGEIYTQLCIYAASDYYPVYIGQYGITMKKGAHISEVPEMYKYLYYGEAEPSIDIYDLFKMEK